jgi:hypothetical protein
LWQALQSFASTGPCQSLLASSQAFMLTSGFPSADFMPSLLWQERHRSKGSFTSSFSLSDPCGLWQFAQRAPTASA